MRRRFDNDNETKKRSRGAYHLNTRVGAVFMAAMLAVTTLGAGLPESTAVQAAEISASDDSAQSTDTTEKTAKADTKNSTAKNSSDVSAADEKKDADTSDKAAGYEYSVQSGDLTVTAKAENGVLPKDAALAVTPLEKDKSSANSISYEAVEQKVQSDLSEKKLTLSGLQAYDISFFENGQRTEPDGTVQLHFSWKTPCAAENVDKDDAVRLLHFEGSDKDLENAKSVDLTDSKDKNNTAAIKLDDNRRISEADVTADSFSIFAFAWEKADETTEKDDAKKTSQIPDKAAVSSENENSASQVTSAPADSSDEEKKTAGSDGEETVSGNVAGGDNSATENSGKDTAPSTGTETASENAAESTQEQIETKDTSAKKAKTENQLTGEDAAHKYTVTVSYDKKAEIPEGTSVKVEELSKNSSAYADAKIKTLKSMTNVDTRDKKNIGFAALDISLVNSDGKKIEPKTDVSVEIRMNELPDTVSDGSSLTVKHIEGTRGDSAKLSLANRVKDGIRSFFTGEVEGVTKVGKTVTAKNGRAVARGTVSGFSVFTITWSTTKNEETYRIGNVSLHYVTNNGLEKDTATDLTSDDLAKLSQTDGGIVKISDWAKTLKADTVTDSDGNVTSSTTYTFDHAVIGDRLNGTEITGVKVQQVTEKRDVIGEDGNVSRQVDVTAYKLYYTTDSEPSQDSNWTVYKDNVSSGNESQDNNVDIWMVYYSGTPKLVTVHYIDTNGNTIAASTKVNAASWGNTWQNMPGFTKDITGYSLIKSGNDLDGHALIVGSSINYTYVTGDRNLFPNADTEYGNISGKTFRYIRYTTVNGTNAFQVGDGYAPHDNGKGGTLSDTVATVPDAKVNRYWTAKGDFDIYLVYSKDANQSKTFTVHYQYQGQDAAYSDAYIKGNTSSTTDTFSLTNGAAKNLVRDSSTESGWADIVHDKKDDGNGVKKVSDNSDLTYMATRLGSADGPEISDVRVKDDGSIVYETNYTYRLIPSQEYPNRYTVEQSSSTSNARQGLQGRRVTLTVGADKNLSLTDSQFGTTRMNLVNEEGPEGSDVHETYTSTLHLDVGTVEYTATKGNNSYALSVNMSIPSTNTNIYQIYIDGDSQSTEKIWIKDDVPYSGLYRVGLSDQLASTLEDLSSKNKNSIAYTWYQIRVKRGEKAPDPATTPGTKVILKQTGSNYNISSQPRYATWLNLEADEGSETWDNDKDIYYYVTVNYTNNEGVQTSVTSTPIKVNWYGRLENGSFETPVVSGTNSNAQYPNTDNQEGAADGYKTSYASQGGVWHTTGLGEDTYKTPRNNYIGHDIEIVNTATNTQYRSDYSWQGTDGAQDGNQFAELNCETAGALYQDVITHSGEAMSYGLSHRARGPERFAHEQKDAINAKYDSMYLVIMPTQLAMTAGTDSKELATQNDLVKFIQNHGGYSTAQATSEENEITYDQGGVLIRRISSSNLDWHTISVTNGYTATGGLTRFFFVAAKTASGNNTVGNFLDNVWFSQTLPTPRGFNLIVKKTFSGLTQKQLAAMATNATVTGGASASNPFTFTITNTYDTDNKNNAALQNAKLQFTATQTDTAGNTFSFEATAKQWQKKEGTNWVPTTEEEYKNKNKDSNDDYRVVDLFADDDNQGTVQMNADGSVTMTWSFAEQTLDGAGTTGTTGNYAGAYRYQVSESNADVTGYRLTGTSSNTTSHPTSRTDSTPITTAPTSSGILNIQSGYTANYNFTNSYRQDHITVQKTFSGITPSAVEGMKTGTNAYKLTVTNETESKVLTLSGDQPDGVTLTETQSGSRKIFTWVIDGWGEGSNYTVEEKNAASSETEKNPSEIKVNGNPLTGNDYTSTSKSGISVSESASISVTNQSGAQDVTSGNTYGTGKNFVVASYTVKPGEGSSETRYLVWTNKQTGSRERTSILGWLSSNKNPLNSANAAIAEAEVTFVSGSPIAPTIVPDGDETYQVVDNAVVLTNGTSSETKWDKVYTANYSFAPDITIENIYDPEVRLLKTDGAATNPARLKGAEFKIYRKGTDSEKEKQYYISQDISTGAITWSAESEGTTGKIFTTGDDGTVNLGILPRSTSKDASYDTYYLEEVKAPDGYQRLAKPISIRVMADGRVLTGTDRTITDDSVDNSKMTVGYQHPYFLITVKNTAGFALPETGGRGIWSFILTGSALLIFGFYLFRRRERLKAVSHAGSK